MSKREFSLKYPISLKNRDCFADKNALVTWVKANLFDFVRSKLIAQHEHMKSIGLPNNYRHDLMTDLLNQLSETFDVIEEGAQPVWHFSISMEFNTDLIMLSALLNVIVECCHKRAYSQVGDNPPSPGDEPIFAELDEVFGAFYPHRLAVGDHTIEHVPKD
jgi:hypothetical protein